MIKEHDRHLKRPTVVSLFSGAGGLDLGFLRAGFSIKWAIDNYSDAVKTYIKNIGRHIDNKPIEDVDLDKVPKSTVIIGGFPCQGFSVANMKRNVDDGRNILYKYFVKIVSLKKPKFFLAENVKGILSLGNGLVFNQILDDFSRVGYDCTYALLNAVNYGVPQFRERVFILGIREDLNININFPPPPTHSKNVNGDLKKWVSIGKALERLPDPDKEHNLKNHIYSKFKLKFNNYIGHRKIDSKKPSPTITARGDLKGGAVIIHHPSNTRRLSCREVACVQGFPLDYEFVGSMSSIYHQIANAVPPSLAESIARTIYNASFEKEKNVQDFAKHRGYYRSPQIQRRLPL